mmetsp:Transcript_8430/g.13469  ORF Transcript_8430/g.13469 Transcript_8430/m.13469 type:complete len:435 (-) Transcript_8430:50-1354(-)
MAVPRSSLRESATFEAEALPCASSPPPSATQESHTPPHQSAAASSLRSTAQQASQSVPPANASGLRSAAQHPGYPRIATVAEQQHKSDNIQVVQAHDVGKGEHFREKSPSSSCNDSQTCELPRKTCCSTFVRFLYVSWTSVWDETAVSHFSGSDKISATDSNIQTLAPAELSGTKKIYRNHSDEHVDGMRLSVPSDSVNDLSNFPHPHDVESPSSCATTGDIAGFAKPVDEPAPDFQTVGQPFHMNRQHEVVHYAVIDTSSIETEANHSLKAFAGKAMVQPETEESSLVTPSTHSTTDDDPNTITCGEPEDGVGTSIPPQSTGGHTEETFECSVARSPDVPTEPESEPPAESIAVGIQELERTVDMIMWRLREATPPEQRHKVFIEQCRAWHPDKNSEDLRKATIAFQRLQSTRGWFLAKDGEYVRQPDDPDLL